MEGRSTQFPRRTIGLLIDQIDGIYQSELWRGVRMLAVDRSINVVAFVGGEVALSGSRLQNYVYGLAQELLVDGLLVATGTITAYGDHSAAFLDQLYPLPIVSLLQPVDDVPSILTNGQAAMRTLVSHLIEAHQVGEVAFIRGPSGVYDADVRWAGYKQALSDHDLPFRPEYVYTGDFQLGSGRAAVLTWMKDQGLRPKAIVACNDEMAFGALQALHELGLSVPEDCILAGFDDLDESKFQNPPLSTIRQPIAELAYHAGEILLDMLDGRNVRPLTILEGTICLRRSCGCSQQELSLAKSVGVLPLDNPKIGEEHAKFVEHAQVLWKLRHIVAGLLAAGTVAEICRKVEGSLPALGIQSASISLFDDPISGALPDPLVKPSSSIALAYSFPSQRTALGGNQENDRTSELQAFFPDRRFTIVLLPIISGSEILGTLFFEYGTAVDVAYGMLVEQIANGITNCRRIERLEVTERRLTYALGELGKSEERYREMAFLLPTIIFETDLALRLVYRNQACQEVFGLPAGMAPETLSLLDFIHPDDRTTFVQSCSKVAFGQLPELDTVRLINAEGRPISMLSRVSLVRHGSRIEGLRWSGLDTQPLVTSISKPDPEFYKLFQISAREQDVVELMLQGYKIREIADRLFISDKTVKAHITSIYTRVGASTREQFFDKVKSYLSDRFGNTTVRRSLLRQLLIDQ